MSVLGPFSDVAFSSRWRLAISASRRDALVRTMKDDEELVCKPTKWFLLRAAAMVVMFGVGAFLFFKDYKIGYPKKNVERYYRLAFEQAKDDFSKHLQSGQDGSAWEAFAGEQKVFRPINNSSEKVEEVAPTVPKGTDLDTRWPKVLVDYEGYSALYETESQFAIPPGWKKYSNSGGRTWSDSSTNTLKSSGKIKQQLYIGILCSVLLCGAVFVFLRTLSRSMKVDGVGFSPAGGKLIPYGSMKRIDARKWDTKGLAYIYYEKDGAEKKAKVDGMVYGQFKKEEGEPAQKLYDRILSNFKGELIELAPDEDEDAAEGELPATTSGNDSED